MCTKPLARETPAEDFRIGGVLMNAQDREYLPAGILLAAELVAAHCLLLDDENDHSDWFADRFWETASILARGLRKFDPTDALSVK